MKCVLVVILMLTSVPGSTRGDFDDKLLSAFERVRIEGRISSPCSNALALYYKNLMSTTDQWALRMLDATSKIPVGLLFTYNFGELGEFEQCLDTQSLDGNIKAKYCLGSLSLSNTSYSIDTTFTALSQQVYLRELSSRLTNAQTRVGSSTVPRGPTWAICLPSDCTDEDAGEILLDLIGSPRAACQTKADLTPPLTNGAIATIVVLSFLACLLVASTICDLYFDYKNAEPPSAILVAFSVFTNGRKLFRMSKNSAELSCLNGIRVLSMLWVIIGHVLMTYVNGSSISNFKAVIDWAESLQSMIIVSGTLSVDSFFLIGGALVVYGFMKAKHNGVNFNIVHFYLHRYLRLTPPFAAAVLVCANLLVYAGSGPSWGAVEASQQTCQKHWWAALLYIQNYVVHDGTCIGQTWYLNVDMQLYVFSPLLLMPLWRYPKIGVTLVLSCILAFIIVPFYVAYDKQLSGILTNFNTMQNQGAYWSSYYFTTHTRAAPWVMGVLLGYILAKIKFFGIKPPEIRKPIVMLLWAICIAVTLTCVFAGHSTLRGVEYDRWGNAFYIALVRPVWAMCLSWVILACVLGYGGPINTLLSFPIYQVLNRFTYSMYLLHLTILLVIASSSKRSVYFSFFEVAYYFWGITMFTFGLSVLWVLAFESPMIVIEKFIFKGINRIMPIGRKSQKSEILA